MVSSPRDNASRTSGALESCPSTRVAGQFPLQPRDAPSWGIPKDKGQYAKL